MKIVTLVKYYPIILNVYILIITIFYELDSNCSIFKFIYPIIGQSFYVDILVLLLSFKLKFCIWHRILIANMMLCLAIETLTNYNIYIKNDVYIMIISTIITIFMSLLIFRKHGTFGTTKSNNRF